MKTMPAIDEVKHLRQRRHARPGHRLLRGHERIGRGVRRATRTTVQRLDLGQCEVLDQLTEVVVRAGVLALSTETRRLHDHDSIVPPSRRHLALRARALRAIAPATRTAATAPAPTPSNMPRAMLPASAARIGRPAQQRTATAATQTAATPNPPSGRFLVDGS